MFKNASHDPLAVPTQARRRSVGPTRRTAGNPADRAGDAWADGRDRGVAEHGRHDLDDNDMHGIFHQDQAGRDPFDGFGPQPNSYSTGPEGSFYGDSDGQFDQPASDWEHELYTGSRSASWYTEKGNVDGQAPVPTGNGVKTDPKAKQEQAGGQVTPPTTPKEPQAAAWKSAVPTPPKVGRVLHAEAIRFLADQNTDDRGELLYRAQRHAAALTSTWTPEASARTTEAFTERVAGLIPKPRRVASAPSVKHIADFPDELLY